MDVNLLSLAKKEGGISRLDSTASIKYGQELLEAPVSVRTPAT